MPYGNEIFRFKGVVSMQKPKPSFAAILMYSIIAVAAVSSAIFLGIYYLNISRNGALLWSGIVAFMIMYHLWTRIIFGNVTKFFKPDYNNLWFREKNFERYLYRLLRVHSWKDKALTYNPEEFSLRERSYEEIAQAMTKAELDHWVNQLISLASILFALLWGQWWIFILTAIAAMVFDGQFILIQRYNRPRILKLLEKKTKRKCLNV